MQGRLEAGSQSADAFLLGDVVQAWRRAGEAIFIKKGSSVNTQNECKQA